MGINVSNALFSPHQQSTPQPNSHVHSILHLESTPTTSFWIACVISLLAAYSDRHQHLFSFRLSLCEYLVCF